MDEDEDEEHMRHDLRCGILVVIPKFVGRVSVMPELQKQMGMLGYGDKEVFLMEFFFYFSFLVWQCGIAM